MPSSDQLAVRTLDTHDDLDETRLAAVGYVFHGNPLVVGAKKAAKAGTNLLHFARCAKLEKAGRQRSQDLVPDDRRIAKEHLDQAIGTDKWKWCKLCEREITQKILNER